MQITYLENKSTGVRCTDLINQFSTSLKDMLNSAKQKYKGVDKAVTSLSDLLKLEFQAKNNTFTSRYLDFFSMVSVLAFLQCFDNDKDLGELKTSNDKLMKNAIAQATEEYNNKHKDDDVSADDILNIGNEDTEGNDDSRKNTEINARAKEIFDSKTKFDVVDCMFGFEGLIELLRVPVEGIKNRETNDKIIIDSFESNLLASIRGISIEEYCSGDYCLRDILLVAWINEVPSEPIETDIETFLKSDNYYGSILDTTVMCIMGTYKYLFQDGFGLKPYEGVLSFDSPFLSKIGESHQVITNKDARLTFRGIANVLKKYYNVVESKSRQFDIEQVINSSAPIYFPYKMLEYASGRELTYRLSEKFYKVHEKSISWDAYSEAYVEKQIRKTVLRGMYLSFSKHFPFSRLGLKSDTSFSDEEFITARSRKEDVFEDICLDTKIKQKVYNDLQRLQQSLCTCVIVREYNYLGGKINKVSLRIVDCLNQNGNGLSENITRELYGQFSANRKVVYDDGEDITNGRKLSDGANLPYRILEYTHDFDFAISSAEPLFGYKAVQLFANRGVKLSWKKILVGEDIKGTPLFASATDKDDINMQANFIHNIMAGSRSGKGVMTMNMLASAIADNKAIFYIDRKPDISVTLMELSKGNMFLVNGGDYQAKNDPHNVFSDTSPYGKAWKSKFSRVPSYLKEMFTGEGLYGMGGAWADYVYFRAVMFALALVVLRVRTMNNPEVYNRLGGEDGVTVIVDEFKNWQFIFEAPFIRFDGKFGNPTNFFGSGAVEEYEKIEDDIKAAKAELGVIADDPKKEAQRVKLNLKIDRLKNKLAKISSEKRIYFREFWDKLDASRATFNGLGSAGFKDAEGALSDFFVVGQNIDKDAQKDAYGRRADGLFNTTSEYKKSSIMRGMFEQDGFASDWFMGYNEDSNLTKAYMGAGTEGTTPNKWITKRRYWGYIAGASMETLRTSEPPQTRYLKTYLVLNNNLEDDPAHPKEIANPDSGKKTVNPDTGEVTVEKKATVPDPEYSFVGQCRKRVIDTSRDPEMWNKIRKKHMAEGYEATDQNPNYGHLHEGIGFPGLISMTKATNGLGEFVPTRDLGRSKEIADYVAQELGYSDYLDFLFDVSLYGLFSIDDIVNHFTGECPFSDVERRIKLYKYITSADDTASDSEQLLSEEGYHVSSDSDSFMPEYEDSDSDSYESDVTEDDSYGSTEGYGSDDAYGGTEGYGGSSQKAFRAMYDEPEDEPEVIKFTESALRSKLMQLFSASEAKYGVTVPEQKKSATIQSIITLFREEGFLE